MGHITDDTIKGFSGPHGKPPPDPPPQPDNVFHVNVADIHLHVHQHGVPAELAGILCKMENSIMSAISDFAAKQTAHNERMDKAVDAIKADVAGLNKKIDELQASAGAVTAEDQAILNDIEAKGDALASKVEALDTQTPPPVPPVTP